MNSKSEANHRDRKHPAHHPPAERHNQSVIVFLTVCSHQRRNIFAEQRMHHVLCKSWASSLQWKVGRYVIMPNHIHLFCSPVGKESENVALWVAYWKRAVSRNLPDLQPIWQRDCWDTQLRRHESYSEKWAYVRNNPVRAGLVGNADDWPFQGELNVLFW